MNLPEDGKKAEKPWWLEKVFKDLESAEKSITIGGTPAPSAYVFITNHSDYYNLDSTKFPSVIVAEGFKIPDFGVNAKFSSIRSAFKAKEPHADLFQLIDSMREHNEIPSTFDGEIPALHFNKISSVPRLKIGNKYLIPCNGNEVAGELITATVAESEKIIYGVYKLEDGRSVIVTCPISDDELEAYKRYKDTFFGVLLPQGKRASDPLEQYEFFYQSVRRA